MYSAKHAASVFAGPPRRFRWPPPADTNELAARHEEVVMRRGTCSIVVGVVVGLFLLASSAFAQITTGTISGRVVDASGGVIPGATVVLISETRGTKSAPVVTNATGDYVFPNVTPDTYTVEVTPRGVQDRQAHRASRCRGGDRVGVPAADARDRAASPKPSRSSARRRSCRRRAASGRSPSPPSRSRTCRSAAANFTSLTAVRPGRERHGRHLGRRHAPRRRQPEQHHDGRHLGHGHGQQRPDAAA